MPHQAPAQRLQRVEVDDVGPDVGAGGPRSGSPTSGLSKLRSSPQPIHRPLDDPPHRQAGLVDLLPGLQRRTLAQPPGVHAHVVAPRRRARARRWGWRVPPLTKFGGKWAETTTIRIRRRPYRPRPRRPRGPWRPGGGRGKYPGQATMRVRFTGR